MDEQQQRRLRLLYLRLDGDDRDIPARDSERALYVLGQDSARASLNEDTESGEAAGRFARKRSHVSLDAAAKSVA